MIEHLHGPVGIGSLSCAGRMVFRIIHLLPQL